MKLSIRLLAARATAVALLAGAAGVALAPAATAGEGRPIDQVAGVVAQLIYPDAEGSVEDDWSAEERIDGWLGYNQWPGGPLGYWGPGPGATGYYGTFGSVIGGPPLPGSTDSWGTERSPFSPAVTEVDALLFGSSEDHTETEESPVMYPGSDEEQPPGDDAETRAVSTGGGR